MKISVNLHHRDCSSILIEENGRIIVDHDGYMPYLNNHLGGDDTNFVIDNDTGMILNWKPITMEQIQEAHNNGELRINNED